MASFEFTLSQWFCFLVISSHVIFTTSLCVFSNETNFISLSHCSRMIISAIVVGGPSESQVAALPLLLLKVSTEAVRGSFV